MQFYVQGLKYNHEKEQEMHKVINFIHDIMTR